MKCSGKDDAAETAQQIEGGNRQNLKLERVQSIRNIFAQLPVPGHTKQKGG
jgi:hypothetical protein